MRNTTKRKRFEALALAHMDSAYNLARRLTRNDLDTEDLVQEAYLRAFQAFDRFHGASGRAWLLTIVRNTFYTWRRLHKHHDRTETFDEQFHAEALASHPDVGSQQVDSPERLAILQADLNVLGQCIDTLPLAWREVLVLRVFEEMSYRDIAEIIGVPKGTVMSRLSRARRALQQQLVKHWKQPYRKQP